MSYRDRDYIFRKYPVIGAIALVIIVVGCVSTIATNTGNILSLVPATLTLLLILVAFWLVRRVVASSLDRTEAEPRDVVAVRSTADIWDAYRQRQETLHAEHIGQAQESAPERASEIGAYAAPSGGVSAAAGMPSEKAPGVIKTKWVAQGLGLCLIIMFTCGLVLPISSVMLIGVTGVLAGSPGKDNEYPAWSPDGSQIAFNSDRGGNNDIYVMQADGSKVVQLTRNPFADLQLIIGIATASDIAPSWSPDGQHIVFATGRDNIYWRYADYNLYEMNPDGSHVTQLTDSRDEELYPAWSPDGRQIAYADTYPDASAGITLLHLDGSRSSELTLHPGDTLPKWSPDGSRIAFTEVRSNHVDIAIINADGGHYQRLTDQALNSLSPTWSPDGRRIAFTSGSKSQSNTYVMNADGSNVVQLTRTNCASYEPAWSPDGRRIAFVSECNGNPDIYVMNADGSNVTQLTGNVGH